MFSYLSILNPGFTTVSNPNPLQVGTLAYVSFLNPPGSGGGVGAGTGFTGTNATGTLNSAGLALSVAPQGAAISAGTSSQNTGTVSFVNSNNFTFGLSAGSVTADVGRTWQVLSQSGGFTQGVSQWTYPASAVQSIMAYSNIRLGFAGGALQIENLGAGTGTSATNASITLNTNGLAISVAAPGGGAAQTFSAGTSSGSANPITFADSNGVAFGLSGGTLTADVRQSYYVYSGAGGSTQGQSSWAQSGTQGLSIQAFSNLRIGLAGGGVLQLENFGAGTGTSGTNATFTLNTNGLAFDGGAYLTTAAGVSHTHGAGPTLTGPVAATSASNGLSLNVNAIGNTTAATNVTWTVGTNGLSLNAGGYAGTGTTATAATFTLNSAGLAFNGGAYLTTAAQVSHSHGNPTLALTNLSGTTASASNGLTLSLSAAAPGAGGGIAVSAGTVAITSGTAQFSNANGVTFGANGQTITASVNAGGGAAPAVRWACPKWAGADFVNLTNITGMTQRPLFFPFECGGNLTGGEIHWRMSRSTSGSNNFTVHLGVYSMVNQTSLALFGSTSNVFSNTATASISGVRAFEMDVGTNLSTLSQGQWVLGLIFSATATASMNYSLMGASTLNPGVGRVVNGSDQYHTYASHFEMPFWGRYTTTTGALPANVIQSNLIGGLSGASLPLPMNFTLASHY